MAFRPPISRRAMRICFGRKEFGEIYHAAAFVAISADHRVTIRGNHNQWQPARDFLNAISPGSTNLADSTRQCPSIGETADVFYRKRHENLPDIVSSKLLPLLNQVPQTLIERATLVQSAEVSCFFWIRYGSYKPERNLTQLAYRQLISILQEAHIHPILIGNSTPFLSAADNNLLDFFLRDPYKQNPLKQLILLNYICEHANVAFSIGMKSGAMDGLAFARKLPTYYISHPRRNKRMDKVTKAFPAFSLVPVNYDKKFIQFSKTELECIYAFIS